MNKYWIVPLLALAATQVQAEAKPTAAAGAKPKLVCFAEPETGSHLRKRTCMTEAQYAERRKRDQEAMSRMKGTTRPLPGGS